MVKPDYQFSFTAYKKHGFNAAQFMQQTSVINH